LVQDYSDWNIENLGLIAYPGKAAYESLDKFAFQRLNTIVWYGHHQWMQNQGLPLTRREMDMIWLIGVLQDYYLVIDYLELQVKNISDNKLSKELVNPEIENLLTININMINDINWQFDNFRRTTIIKSNAFKDFSHIVDYSWHKK